MSPVVCDVNFMPGYAALSPAIKERISVPPKKPVISNLGETQSPGAAVSLKVKPPRFVPPPSENAMEAATGVPAPLTQTLNEAGLVGRVAPAPAEMMTLSLAVPLTSKRTVGLAPIPTFPVILVVPETVRAFSSEPAEEEV